MEAIQATEKNILCPYPQPLALKLVARFLSYVFHPLFIPLYVSAYIIYIHPYSFAVFNEKQKFLRLVSVFVVTGFFPAITVFLLWRLRFADSIMLRTQKERIIPYVSSTIYYFWAYYIARNLPGTPVIMASFFLGTFLCTSAAVLANNYFKISMHGLAVGGAATFMIFLGLVSIEPMGAAIAIATLITGMVSSSRLIVSDHNPKEVYWGLFLGSVSQLIAGVFLL